MNFTLRWQAEKKNRFMAVFHPVATMSILATVLAIAMLGIAFGKGVKIPIGDGKISSSPRVGFVYSCQQRFNPNAPGAHASGVWIRGNYWYPESKPTVDGSVRWPGGGASLSVVNGIRTIATNNLPTHTTGNFPIRRNDDAYRYDRNPNSIIAQRVNLSFPANPTIASTPTCVSMGMIGISLTGAAIFNALDARGDDAVAHEIQDKCSGHPEHSGQYHYHGPSKCLSEKGKSKNGHSGLVGYALDGFGIFGLKGVGGKFVSNRSLDQCHGHTETVIWDGKSKKMYHYHLTREYPYTVGCFRGTPKNSGRASMQPGGRTGMAPEPDRNRRGSRNPHAVLSIAAQILGVSTNRLRQAIGAPPPNFHRAARTLGISERKIRDAMRSAHNRSIQ